jgi:hypothetical protein
MSPAEVPYLVTARRPVLGCRGGRLRFDNRFHLFDLTCFRSGRIVTSRFDYATSSTDQSFKRGGATRQDHIERDGWIAVLRREAIPLSKGFSQAGHGAFSMSFARF